MVGGDGWGGDTATAQVLGRLSAFGWRHLDALRGPGDPAARTDHVAIGPGGIFVVASQAWTAGFAVSAGVVGGNACEVAATGCRDAATAIADGLPRDLATVVTPVLCVSYGKAVTGWSQAVSICSTVNLASMLACHARLLTSADILEAATLLNAMVGSPAVPGTTRPGRVRPPDLLGSVPAQPRP